jgi:hypothetical protein
MPFDPAWPQNGQNIDADRFRGQFAGIIDLIGNGSGINAAQVDGTNTLPPSTPANASVAVVGNMLHFTFEIPQGQEGPMGQQGPPFANAVVDAVNTVNPGDPATVAVNFDGTNVHFTFNIPRGNDGSGSPGPQGNDGAQGPPFAQTVVDGVTTLDPGQPATVQTTFDGTNVRFTFSIPRGSDGTNGAPGEVTQAQLDTAILGTSGNTNAVSTLDSVFADPDLEAIRQKLNEMILNGRR